MDRAEDIKREIEDRGWALVDLPEPLRVFYLADRISDELSLEDYCSSSDDAHDRLQEEITNLLHITEAFTDLIRPQAPLLDQIVGPDFLIQAKPHLRIARPGVERDNVGYHRDTDYGAQPEELSVWVPFVDLPAAGSLCVADGSHRWDVPVFETVEGSTGVMKGDRRHRLGFPYAPKMLGLTDAQRATLHGVPVKVGQALIFRLDLVHGTVVNASDVTRWSADIRIAPAAFAAKARPGYYLEPVTA